jgi:hypothetical protein
MNRPELRMNKSEETEQERIWEDLHKKILEVLAPFGDEDHFGKADYLVVDDNYGWTRHTIEIHKLRMLDPTLVQQLRALLHDFADWEIVISVDIPGTEDTWPPMGLIIRKHEIIDGLQRSFLPPELNNLVFEGSRPGTGFD